MSDIFQGMLQTAEFVEEHFVAESQARLAEMLDEKGVSRAELARKLGVSRARVTQIFADDATNFTLRLLARSFLALDEEPVILTRKEYDRLIASADSSASHESQSGNRRLDTLSASLIAELLRAGEVNNESDRSSRRADSAGEWAKTRSNVVPLRRAASGQS
jgi:transcriptional regulator with XRE-family HTH domain